jgi:hypothetical protein
VPVIASSAAGEGPYGFSFELKSMMGLERAARGAIAAATAHDRLEAKRRLEMGGIEAS